MHGRVLSVHVSPFRKIQPACSVLTFFDARRRRSSPQHLRSQSHACCLHPNKPVPRAYSRGYAVPSRSARIICVCEPVCLLWVHIRNLFRTHTRDLHAISGSRRSGSCAAVATGHESYNAHTAAIGSACACVFANIPSYVNVRSYYYDLWLHTTHVLCF